MGHFKIYSLFLLSAIYLLLRFAEIHLLYMTTWVILQTAMKTVPQSELAR